jgi:CRISPR/Cas system-associated endonuclease Cas3-HD
MKKLLKKINAAKFVESPNKLLEMVPHSVRDKFEKISSVRIQAYLLFGAIIGFALFFLGVELTSAIIAWIKTGIYTLSSEILIVFGALLTHHLALLFNKRKEYSKDEKINDIPAISDLDKAQDKEEIKEEQSVPKVKNIENPIKAPNPAKKVTKAPNPLNDVG